MALSALTPTQLQSAYTATAAVRDHNQHMLVADRGPSWIRLMSHGRSLDAQAAALQGAADGIATEGAGNAYVPKTVDYLRGAAWHAQQGIATMRSGITEALAGHADLQAQASAMLDPKTVITVPNAYTDFETAVKRIDPSLLQKIEAAAAPAIPSFERARADVEESRGWLRDLAQTIPH
jgi:hypothetical protein